MSGSSSLWQEARNADGRIYYYNVRTKATQWAKPVELMTPVEVSGLHHQLLSPSFTYRNIVAASFIEPAMEGIYSRRWEEVLVQYRNQAKHMGNARRLQNSTCTGPASYAAASQVRPFEAFQELNCADDQISQF